MSENAVQRREYLFPERTSQAMEQLNQVDAEMARLKSLKEKLRGFLKQSIEVKDVDPKHREGESDGVVRKDHMQKQPSYMNAMNEIIETLVPTRKHDRAKEIVINHTEEIWVTKFSMPEDEGDGEF